MIHIPGEFLARPGPSDQLPTRWIALSHILALSPNPKAQCALFTQGRGDLIIIYYALSFSPFTLIVLSFTGFSFLPDHMMAVICRLGISILLRFRIIIIFVPIDRCILRRNGG